MRKLAITLGLIFIGLGATYAALHFAMSPERPPAFVASFIDQEKDYEKRSRLFSEHVQRLFPIGSDSKELTAFLSKQRFEGVSTRSPGELYYSFQRGGFPCNDIFSVHWKEDVSGRIVMMQARLTARCL